MGPGVWHPGKQKEMFQAVQNCDNVLLEEGVCYDQCILLAKLY